MSGIPIAEEERALRALFARYPEVIFGFADIAYSRYAGEYASALVFAVPYGEQLTLDTYDEARFHRGIQAARAELEQILLQTEDVLKANAARYWIPPVAQADETELLAPFSFKFAAVHAGLGWIGRNDVLITERYGPRVRLSAVLIDGVFEYGHPMIEVKCPDDCTVCVDACPCSALKSHTWNLTSRREDLIDYHRCNRMRSAYIGRLGRKNDCGLCMAACPFGQPTNGIQHE